MTLFRHRQVCRSARRVPAALLLGFIGFVTSPANAATEVWNSTGASQNWLTNTNWSPTTVPASGDIGSFNGTANPSDGQVGFTAGTSFGAISLSLTSSSITFGSIGSGGSRSLTINGATVNAVANTIFADTTTAATTLTIIPQIGGNKTLALMLGNTANVIQASSGNTIDLQTGLGEAAANSTLTFQGDGLLILNAANSYTGLTTITAGTLREGISNAISTGGLTVNGATAVFDLGASHSDTVGTVTLQGGGSITGTGTSALTSTGTFEVQSGSVSAILAGSGVALNKTTGGTVTLSGANTYTGATTISAGTLQLGNGGTTGSLSASSTITDNGNLTINRSNAVAQGTDFSGSAISGTGSFTQAGSGTTTLIAANTYIGVTTVNAGTLLVNGSTASGSAVAVNNSGTVLGGTGTIGGTVNVNAGAVINAGPQGADGTSGSVGTLTTGALTLASTATFHGDAFGTVASAWDKLMVNGTATLGSATLQIIIASGLTFTPNTTYVVIDGTALSGTFNGIADNQLVTFSGYQFIADYDLVNGNFDLIAVPEPSTWLAAALTMGAIGFAQRKRVRAYARVINECVSTTIPK